MTYFNCGHVTTSLGGETTRDFTLIIDENQKIPISDEGHVFDGWTFNGTIPGPTMRVTQGDQHIFLVKDFKLVSVTFIVGYSSREYWIWKMA